MAPLLVMLLGWAAFRLAGSAGLLWWVARGTMSSI